MSLAEFLHMGGYAPYVWSAYGLAALVLFLNLWLPARRLKRAQARIRRQARRREGAS